VPQTNPRSLANLRRGGTRSPGRRPIDREAREWERRFLESEEYRESARRRVLAGKAPHLERLRHEHVYGKATDRVELSGAEHSPVRIIEVQLPPDQQGLVPSNSSTVTGARAAQAFPIAGAVPVRPGATPPTSPHPR
jgi:hypothetical protein